MPAVLARTNEANRCPHNVLRAFAVAAALLLAGWSPGAAQEGAVTLRGQVVDARTGQPLANAVVEIATLERGTRTDMQGRFFLVGLPAGTYDVAVSRLGYEDLAQTVGVPGPAEGVVLRLAEDPVRMAAIHVEIDRLERRRLNATIASRAFDEAALHSVRHASVGRFLQDAGGVRPTACSNRELLPACVYSRGETHRPVVVLDEHVTPGGLEALQGLPLDNLYRLEVYDNGTMVVAYTRFYVASAIKRNRPLHPLSAFRRRMVSTVGI